MVAGSRKNPYAPYIAEFIGVFFIGLSQGLALVNNDEKWRQTSTGFCVMACTYATYAVSGGHLNPALSIAFGSTGRCKWRTVWNYCMTHAAAGIMAGFVASHMQLIIEEDELTTNTTVASGGGRNGALTQTLTAAASIDPRELSGGIPAVLVEATYTCILCFVALACMESNSNNPKGCNNQYFALAIGFIVVAGGYAASGTSPGAFNPAVMPGIAILGQVSWIECAQLILVQLSSAAPATMLFYLVWPDSHHTGPSAARTSQGERNNVAGQRPFAVSQSRVEEKTPRATLSSRLVSEFVGTFTLVLTHRLSAVPYYHEPMEGALSTSVAPSLQVGPKVTPGSWAAGAALLSMVCSLASVSGAHLNPAVTLAVVCSERSVCLPRDGLYYMGTQVAAGFTAGLVALFLRSEAMKDKDLMLGPKHHFGWPVAVASEMGFTAILALVVLTTTTVSSPSYPKAPKLRDLQVGLSIGFCMSASAFALENVSGGLLNPAIALGTSTTAFVNTVLNNDFRKGFAFLASSSLWEPLAIFSFWELLGGVIAARVFIGIHPLEYKPDPLIANS